MNLPQPYLSVVATARNDDHGGNLLGRVQTFLNALIAQTKRYNLPIELVLVEWNPPAEKPCLAEALRWPADFGPFQARIITVPPEVHERYRFGQALPLYQMIGKNAGIRRATGEFILATNIDILFSDELMQFFAERNLERDRMYRIDRHDVETDVPVDAAIDDQLAYCRTHRIRLNATDGTYLSTPEGFRKPAPRDAVSLESGIFFGAGWYPPEQLFGQLFRWASDEAEIHLVPSDKPRVLLLETESGPGTAFGPFHLEVLDGRGTVLGESVTRKRSFVRIMVSPQTTFLRLRVRDGGRPAAYDKRTLNFRVTRCKWDNAASASSILTVSPAAPAAAVHVWRRITGGFRFLSDLRRNDEPRRIGVPVPRRLIDQMQFRLESYGFSFAIRPNQATPQPEPDPTPALLHTNACGDFTLVHRDHWFNLRGYPEFDMYSMNIDSLFCFMAHYGGATEQVLSDPKRIYHIEHGAGSGWTPEGSRLLFQRLAAKGIPWIEYSEVLKWAAVMERYRTPLVFNHEDWGLAKFDLPDAKMPV